MVFLLAGSPLCTHVSPSCIHLVPLFQALSNKGTACSHVSPQLWGLCNYLSVAPCAHAPFNSNLYLLFSCHGNIVIRTAPLTSMRHVYVTCVPAFLELHPSRYRHVLAMVALQLTFQGTNPVSTFAVSSLPSAVLCYCAPACYV